MRRAASSARVSRISVSCDYDKTNQNSNNVIDKTNLNNSKKPLKNEKNANQNLANTKALSTNDNFTSTCFEHPIIEKNASTNIKNTSEVSDK